jgi:hypothetical protein
MDEGNVGNPETKMQLEQRLLKAAQDYLAYLGRTSASVAFPSGLPPVFVIVGTEDDLPQMLVNAARRFRRYP